MRDSRDAWPARSASRAKRSVEKIFGTLFFRDLIYGLEFEIETDFDENAKMQVDFVD
jgi:hypothetical protein